METIPKVIIERVKLPTETLGSLYVDKVLQAKTMELPWRENAHNTSCIPNGLYKVVKEAYTEKHPYPHFRVLGVPDRGGILWHKITYVKDLLGCTGIGGSFADLNKDSVPDIVDSGKTLQKLYDMLPAEFWVLYKDRD
jgi:hypothetical protein